MLSPDNGPFLILKAEPEPGASENNKWDAQELAHIKSHTILKFNLILFQEFDEKTGYENQNQCKAYEGSLYMFPLFSPVYPV